MIGLPNNVSIYLCTEPVDFRNGFDGLSGIVTASLGHTVTDGSLFLFVNRKRDRFKALSSSPCVPWPNICAATSKPTFASGVTIRAWC